MIKSNENLWTSRQSTLLVSLFLIFLTFVVFNYHWQIVTIFNFRWTDMDQVFMWFGVDEIQKGRFHMPRYFGQDYGSMLEAWLAAPFRGVPFEKLLPSVAYFILVFPYILIALTANAEDRWRTVLLVVLFLGFMPPEYIMTGAMPRDMGSGLFITSLAILFAFRPLKWASVLTGFFCILGWSFNSNAGPLGALILLIHVLTFYKTVPWKSIVWPLLGIILALIVHLSVARFYSLNPNLIVHHQWQLDFSFRDLWLGLSRLDLHWGMITPVFHGKGWVYLVFFIGLIAAAISQKNRIVWISTILFLLLVLSTLGLNKVHDARQSVFFSHERMYLALPLGLLLLMTRISIPMKWLILLVPACITMDIYEGKWLRQTIDKNLIVKDHLLIISTVDDVYKHCSDIERIWLDQKAEAIFYGPGDVMDSWVLSRACPCITEINHMVRPEYERKTWELNELNHPDFNRILWIVPCENDSIERILKNVEVSEVEVLHNKDRVLLIEGSNMNPMDLYLSMNYECIPIFEEPRE